MGSWLRRAYRGFDRAVGGYAPGGHRPIHELGGEILANSFSSLSDVAKDPFGRAHSSSEAEIARGHATNERLAGQGFASHEANIAREFADEQRGKAEAFSSAEAVAARQHQEYMARNQTSMQMEGMRAAGLNPILAAQFGGATPPPGPAATSHAPSVPQAHGVGSSSPSAGSPISALRDILGVVKLGSEIRNLDSATQSNLSDSGYTDSRKLTEDSTREGQVNRIQAEIKDIEASEAQKRRLVDLVNEQIKEAEFKVRSAKSQAEVDEVVSDFKTGVGGSIERWSDAVGLKGRDVTQLVGAIVGLSKFFKHVPRKKSSKGDFEKSLENSIIILPP